MALVSLPGSTLRRNRWRVRANAAVRAAVLAAIAAASQACTWHVHQLPPSNRPSDAVIVREAPQVDRYYEPAPAWRYEGRDYRHPRTRTVCRTTHRIGKGVATIDIKRCRQVRHGR